MTSAEDFAFVDCAGLDTAAAYRLVVGCVVPRPIAWITTVDAAGRVNAAPFSSYNYVATSPPMLAVNIAQRAGDGAIKDTARNIRDSGEFVVNVATEETMEAMHATGFEYPPEQSEALALDLALLPSRHVRVPRLAATPVQMECRLDKIVPLGRGVNTLYIGEVVAFHLAHRVYDGTRVDSVAMRPVARLGGPYYAALGEIIHRPMLQRPPGGEGWTGAEKP
ncbi:flavin reductase family protein [Roseomonas sp. AR75]|uniref:flavin reductase family protein n=1 Tax=Roseomonas sp. AR75 TaxID=2562311 RepID=UPI0010C00DC5|nr:flavin reductase family protein [Roseomonas sp. AR75]